MNVSAFIRSYRNDFEWLKYCLRALAIRGKEFREIVVIVPQDDYALLVRDFDLATFRAFAWNPQTVNGYIDQQITKCFADDYCQADFIMHFDSDCVATQEIRLDEFFSRDHLPKLLFRRWEDAGTAETWRLTTRGVLGVEPQFETMASHPFVYHRSTHELFRRHVAAAHGGDFIKYVSRLAHFSEFNAIGNYAHLFTPDAYQFVRCGDRDGYPRPFKQHWSRGPMKREEMEALLR